MTYKENPKTKGSGIVCCIPQTGRCPMECPDCFFQSGRSYLDLENDLPNMPDEVKPWQIVRVNDGNDSNHRRGEVIKATRRFPLRFYNTCQPSDLAGFGEPVVVTVNPAGMTDERFHRIEVTRNLMFVRIRTNTWNLQKVVWPAIGHYTSQGVPVVLTFMAYHDESSIPEKHRPDYTYRKRTSNAYFAIWKDAWRGVMLPFDENPLIYSCGMEGISTACARCGNCAREFMRVKAALREG